MFTIIVIQWFRLAYGKWKMVLWHGYPHLIIIIIKDVVIETPVCKLLTHFDSQQNNTVMQVELSERASVESTYNIRWYLFYPLFPPWNAIFFVHLLDPVYIVGFNGFPHTSIYLRWLLLNPLWVHESSTKCFLPFFSRLLLFLF